MAEPMIKMRADEQTAVTRDRSLSAAFGHSIGVTADGVESITLTPQGLHAPGVDRATVLA